MSNHPVNPSDPRTGTGWTSQQATEADPVVSTLAAPTRPSDDVGGVVAEDVARTTAEGGLLVDTTTVAGVGVDLSTHNFAVGAANVHALPDTAVADNLTAVGDEDDAAAVRATLQALLVTMKANGLMAADDDSAKLSTKRSRKR